MACYCIDSHGVIDNTEYHDDELNGVGEKMIPVKTAIADINTLR